MTQIGSIYGESLYQLAKEENLTRLIGAQVAVLQQSFRQEPDFLRLLFSPCLAKAERCQILDGSFRSKVHPYVLNFLKILTEKGYVRYFSDCCNAYTIRYNQENNILPVNAVSAVELSAHQKNRLTRKLSRITGKEIALRCRIDPTILGGIRLDYDGHRLDDTVSHRLDAIRNVLNKTVQ